MLAVTLAEHVISVTDKPKIKPDMEKMMISKEDYLEYTAIQRVDEPVKISAKASRHLNQRQRRKLMRSNPYLRNKYGRK